MTCLIGHFVFSLSSQVVSTAFEAGRLRAYITFGDESATELSRPLGLQPSGHPGSLIKGRGMKYMQMRQNELLILQRIRISSALA